MQLPIRCIKLTDILDQPADALIYSTNILFNCTGGVGGAMLMRYGPHVQQELHAIVRSRNATFMNQGDVIDYVPTGLPYRHILHTFPCDGMYDTTPEIVENVLHRALKTCGTDPEVKQIAVSALATGYGHMLLDEFLPIADRVFHLPDHAHLPEIVLCLPYESTLTWCREIIEEKKLRLSEADQPSQQET